MNYEIDKTRFKHQLWGEGTLRKVEGSVLTVDFLKFGCKSIMDNTIRTGVLTVINQDDIALISESQIINHKNNFRQYDTSDVVIGGMNVVESFETDDVVIFNESYTIIGEQLSAKKISATYDLTIIGDVSVDEIAVNGDLIVVGDLSANKVSCANKLICNGYVDVDYLYVGSIIARSVKCVEFTCDENAIIETTIDIDRFSKTEKTMVACEGIIGDGEFSACNAIANEYFEFTGDVQGNVLELFSNTKLNGLDTQNPENEELSKTTIDEVIHRLEERLQEEYSRCVGLEEYAIVELTKLLSDNSLHTLKYYYESFEQLTKISYKDKIDDFGDYLIVMDAKKKLPKEIYLYETIEHIDSLLLPRAEKVLEELDFSPKSVGHLARCIQIVIECANDISIDVDSAFDKIFSSIGIRYSTVKNILRKLSYSISNEGTITEGQSTETESKTYVVDKSEDKPSKKKVKMSKSKFLGLSIQDEAKYFGITVEEQVRLASARIKTCGDFLRMSEQDLKAVFRKKLFLANHLYQAQQKMKAAFDEMDED